jgi:hypothetical protein
MIKDKAGLMLAILDWVLDEQMEGRRPNDIDVAKRFGLTVEQATAIHDELEEMGEFN